MKHRYVAPSDSSVETLAVIDEMNALLEKQGAMIRKQTKAIQGRRKIVRR